MALPEHNPGRIRDPLTGGEITVRRCSHGTIRVSTFSAHKDFPATMSDEEALAEWLKMRDEIRSGWAELGENLRSARDAPPRD